MSCANAPIPLPNWMPSDAQQAWTDFYSVVGWEPGSPMRREARYMLQRFAMRSAMEKA